MVLVIIQEHGSKLRIERYTKDEWATMQSALGWEKEGNWNAIKEYVYRHGWHKKKRQQKRKSLLRKIIGD